MAGESALSEGSGEGFARIDLISNHTALHGQEHYRSLLRGNDLPVHTISSFIHEATHHWCFTSPVGMALSLLFLSAAKNMLRWSTGGKTSHLNRALDDLCTFDLAVTWLRPLSEGLAQFAEYDVRPLTYARLQSPPLVATLTHLFNLGRRLKDTDDDWKVLQKANYELLDDIDRWRLSRRVVERKAELLLQPINARGSAYLLGYLTIKQLWKNAARFYPELANADCFMVFLRKLVFGDHALVAELLDRKRPAFERGLRFSRALHTRLQTIRLMTFADDVPWSEWEKMMTPPPPGTHSGSPLVADGEPFATLDTQKAVAKGLKLQQKYVHDVLKLELFEIDGAPLPPDFFFDVLRERYLMWLGDVPAKWVSIGKHKGRILVDSEVLYDNYSLTEISDENLDDLRLDVYIDLYEGHQLTTLANERGVFGFATRWTLEEKTRSQLLNTRLDRQRIVKLTALLRTFTENVVQQTNYRAQLESFWNGEASDLLDGTYRMYAFNTNKKAESVFARHGVAGALHYDSDLVRSVAAISLAASAEMSPEGFVSMSELPVNPEETIRRLSTLWPVSDFPIAAINEDGFLASSL